MRKSHLIGAISISALLFGTHAWGAAWTIGSNTRIVQKGGGGTNIFPSITAALANIPGNNTTPILIKVLPGNYNTSVSDPETFPIQMKPFVDLEGSGQANTVINASNVPLDRDWYDDVAPANATIVMASNSRLSNLRVQNNSSANGIAILVTKPSVTIEDVSADASGPGNCAIIGGYYAIGIRESTATGIVLRNVTATSNWTGACVSPQQADCRAIAAHYDTEVAIIGSKAIATGGGSVSGILSNSNTVVIRDTYAEGGNSNAIPPGFATGIEGSPGTLVQNTRAYGHDATDCHGTTGAGPIQHSEIRAGNCSTRHGILGSTAVAGTLIEGGYYNVDKITSCWDENFDPISYP